MEEITQGGIVLEVAKPNSLQRVASGTPADLLRVAVAQGADLDKLERLMAMQERWQAAHAKQAYDTAFGAFKAEAIQILKSTAITQGPLQGKKYAELFTVVDAVTPALSRHGMSSAWKITKDERDWIEVTCYLKHVDGHVEAVSMGGPPDTGGAKSPLQARASTVSFLERYTLKAVTGTAERGDDKNDSGGEPEESDPLLDEFRAAALEGHGVLKALYFKTQDDAELWKAKGEKLWAKHGAGLKDAATKAEADSKGQA